MITHEEAQIQHGIAKFLHGGIYGCMLRVNTLETRFGRAMSSIERDRILREQFHNDCQAKMTTNGMPSRCFSCPHFDCNLASRKDERNFDDILKCCLSCKNDGCDIARQDFVENFEELESSGRAAINIDVTIEELKTIEMTDVYGRINRAPIESGWNKINITPSFISFGDSVIGGSMTISKNGQPFTPRSRSMEMPQELSGPFYKASNKQTDIQAQEQEIAELIELETANDMSCYGEVAW